VRVLRSIQNWFTPHRRERSLVALCFILGAALFIGGRSLPEVRAGEQVESDLYDDLKTFTDVLSVVQRDYVREVPSRKLVEGAIKGMLTTLDPHSGYLDPNFYKDLQVQTKGEFGGLGIEITIRDGLLIVVSPMEGSPAEKAGLKTGDAIVKIDGKFAKEFSLVDAVKTLRGPKGSVVTLSIHRKGNGDLIDIPVVRDNIMVRSVRHRLLGEGFGYVRISQFMEKTTEDLRAALSDLRKQQGGQEIRGLVLDLRNNPGGLLTQAIGVSDTFLREGVIVYTDGRVVKQKQRYFAHEGGTEAEYPIIAVVNGGSASAAEIVAGALKDHGRALVLGTQTFGKGSVQTITPLENGGAITLTTALYYTKSGRSIQVTGVKPDIEMEQPAPAKEEVPDQQRSPIGQMREGDLPGAILNPNGQGDPTKRSNKPAVGEVKTTSDQPVIDPMKEELPSFLGRDPQLQRALDLLKTFNIFKAPREDGMTVAALSVEP
jgi:carboxyl-terminal processing protease